MDNFVTDCVRCSGRGTIDCPERPRFGVNLNLYGNESQCRICKGVKELQCPACRGRAKVKLAEAERTLDTLDEPKVRQARDRNSTARQVLAVHTLLDAAKANLDNKSAEVRFIKFLIGKNSDDILAKLTEIRERGNPSDRRSKKSAPRSSKSRRDDLQFIRPFFEELSVTTIINTIDDEISSID